MASLIPVGLGEIADDTSVVNKEKLEKSESTPSKLKITNENSVFFLIDHDSKIAKMWLFGVIGGGPTRYIKTLSIIQALTEEWELHCWIHSPGGCIITTCHIISALANCRGLVVTHNLGLAASCGSLILAVGNKIHVAPNSVTMFHGAGMGLMDLVHRLATKVDHTTRFVDNLFTTMKSKGLVIDSEYDAIVKRGEEFYITSTEMEKRLRGANLWYEGAKHANR